jgi:multiple sugar transport system substrate-binding protein
MRHAKKIIAAAAAACTLLVTACSSGGAGGSGGDKGNLTMTIWSSDKTLIGLYQDVAAEFKKTHPDFGSLTVQTLPFANYLDQLTTQLNGGKAPDIGWVVDEDGPALAKSGALVNLKPTMTSTAGYNFSDILPTTLKDYEYQGGVYAYPFANTTQPIIFNADLFAQAHVQNPLQLLQAGQWTWANLEKIAKQLVDAKVARFGFDLPNFAYTTYTQLTPIFNAFGAQAWPGGNTCGYDSPQMADAISFLRKLIYLDKSFPAPGQTSSFASGDTGMIISPPSFLNTLATSKFHFDLVPEPAGTSGTSNPYFGQAGLAVFQKSDHQKLATQFLTFLSNEANSKSFAKYFIPPRKTLLTPTIVTQQNTLLTADAAKRSLIDPLMTVQQIDFPAALPQITSAIKPDMDKLWQPSADVTGDLSAVCSAAKPLLTSGG